MSVKTLEEAIFWEISQEKLTFVNGSDGIDNKIVIKPLNGDLYEFGRWKDAYITLDLFCEGQIR